MAYSLIFSITNSLFETQLIKKNYLQIVPCQQVVIEFHALFIDAIEAKNRVLKIISILIKVFNKSYVTIVKKDDLL